MATLAVQTIVPAGIVPTFAAVAAGGDEFPNDGNTYIELINSHGVNTYTVTITTPATFKGVAIENPTVALAASQRKKVGPFPQEVFNNSNNRVALAYAGTAPATDLTVGVFKGV